MSFVPPLASIAAVRPVFMIVMGISLLIIACRLARAGDGWSARLIAGGAFFLSLGYAVVLPLAQAGKLPVLTSGGHFHGDPGLAVAWHAVKNVLMNAGWLMFGLGLALHARVFTATPRRTSTTRNSHGSVA